MMSNSGRCLCLPSLLQLSFFLSLLFLSHQSARASLEALQWEGDYLEKLCWNSQAILCAFLNSSLHLHPASLQRLFQGPIWNTERNIIKDKNKVLYDCGADVASNLARASPLPPKDTLGSTWEPLRWATTTAVTDQCSLRNTGPTNVLYTVVSLPYRPNITYCTFNWTFLACTRKWLAKQPCIKLHISLEWNSSHRSFEIFLDDTYSCELLNLA